MKILNQNNTTQASSILAKVNQAIGVKKTESVEAKTSETEEDVLELVDVAKSEKTLPLGEPTSTPPQENNGADTLLLEKKVDSSTNNNSSSIEGVQAPSDATFHDIELNLKSQKTALSKEKSEDKKMKQTIDISEHSAEQTTELFRKLKNTAQSKKESEALKFRSGTTVEELISELVKPLLSPWLDKNLPNIVKECVEKEVKKLLPKED
ncbi:MAG: DUF2497 domain-containing protein [Rickettsiaceae bacterium]|nr:DUF2497 domain-containing protein [Rickettsiaceae bacterium]